MPAEPVSQPRVGMGSAAQSAESVRVGRWLGLWTVERWNPRIPCWDVVYTFTTQEKAEAGLAAHIDGVEGDK